MAASPPRPAPTAAPPPSRLGLGIRTHVAVEEAVENRHHQALREKGGQCLHGGGCRTDGAARPPARTWKDPAHSSNRSWNLEEVPVGSTANTM